MSTLEAEYIACSNGSHQAKLLLQLPRDIHGKDSSPLPTNYHNRVHLDTLQLES